MTSEELAAMTAEFEQGGGKIEQLAVVMRAPRKTGFSLRSTECIEKCNANDSKLSKVRAYIIENPSATAEDIVKALGCAKGYPSQAAMQLGVVLPRAERKQAQRPAVTIAAAWLLANPGSDVNAIMSGAGVSRSTARSARLLVFPDSPRGVSGATPSKRDAVIVLMRSPITDKMIAERVGCSLNYVHKIRRGEF